MAVRARYATPKRDCLRAESPERSEGFHPRRSSQITRVAGYSTLRSKCTQFPSITHLMQNSLIYFAALIFFFVISLVLAIYWVANLIANFIGSPFVPTSKKVLDDILTQASLKKGQIFMEFGSGDARVVNMAAQKYGVVGIGIEVNPLLVLYSIINARIKKIKNVNYKMQNFFDIDIANADVIFLFLMPDTLKKLKIKFASQGKKNLLIISHGFSVEGWEKKLEKKIKSAPFPTYFYRLRRNRS